MLASTQKRKIDFSFPHTCSPGDGYINPPHQYNYPAKPPFILYIKKFSVRDGGDVVRHDVHAFGGEAERDGEELAGDVGLVALESQPGVGVKDPEGGVAGGGDGGGAVGGREEGELAARRALHDGLRQPALRRLVVRPQLPALHQVEPGRGFAPPVQHLPRGHLHPREVRLRPEPEVLVLRAHIVEHLQHEPQRLAYALPPRRAEHLLLRQDVLGRLVESTSSGRLGEDV